LGNQEITEVPDYLTLGRHSYGTIHRIGREGEIRVGNFTSIASDVKALMVGHDVRCISTFPFTSREHRGKFKGGHPKTLVGNMKWYNDIGIGHDVWIGYGSIIRGGIIINNGAVIGAGAVVMQDVAPYSIVTGNPAKEFRLRFAQSQIDELMKIQWWEWDDSEIEDNLYLLCGNNIEQFLARHRR